MGCNCGNKSGAARTYTVSYPDGTKKSYKTEVEAAAAAKRVAGATYKAA